MLKSIASVLLLCLINSLVVAEPKQLTNKKIQYMFDNNPQQGYHMIRKLWILEKTQPKITLPETQLIWLGDGNIVVQYSEPGYIFWGDTRYNLQASFNIEPKATVGWRENYEIHPAWYILGMVAIFAGGIATGVWLGGMSTYTH